MHMHSLFEDTLRIENERIMICPVSSRDKTFLGDLFGDVLPEDKTDFMIKALDANRKAGKKAALAVYSLAENVPVGVIEIHSVTPDISIGYRIRPQYRNLHYCRDAVYLLVSWLMEHTDTEALSAEVRENNEYSIRVLTHNGFELAGNENGTLHYIYRRKEKEEMVIRKPEEGLKIIWCAGGCFWGTEKVFRALDGVRETVTGYVNGNTDDPHYEDVCRNDTGYKEAVEIIYDPSVTPLSVIMKAFFLCIDPTVFNRQGNDIGSQYQTGVYYSSEEDGIFLKEYFEEERKKHRKFMVELEEVRNFWPAEEYHQRYLDKHPDGYCHITRYEMEAVRALNQKGKEHEEGSI